MQNAWNSRKENMTKIIEIDLRSEKRPPTVISGGDNGAKSHIRPSSVILPKAMGGEAWGGRSVSSEEASIIARFFRYLLG